MNKKAVVASRHHRWAGAAAIMAVCLFTVTTLPAASQSQTDLARAYRTISSKTFVDLTHSFGPDTPVWSGFGQAKFRRRPIRRRTSRTPFRKMASARPITRWSASTARTSIRRRISPKAASPWKILLKQMILPLVVLDDTPYLAKDPNHAFSVEDLKVWNGSMDVFPKAPSPRCARTCTRIGTPIHGRFERSPFPAWAFETIKFLYEQRGVTATGHESMDTDTTDKMDSETYILRHGHYQIEVMANLDKVPPIGSLIAVSWPKVRDGLGFPARAFAILP